MKQKTWFNGQKKIYAMINTIIQDHHELFIYINIIFQVMS